MAHLFEIQDKIVYPTPEILLVEPFKSIWRKDRTRNKVTALKEFAYIEFMVSAKGSNPYRGYDKSVRKEKLIEYLFNENWEESDLVIEGMKYLEIYQTDASPTYSYYRAVRRTMEQLKKFLNNVDINERDENTGKPIWKPSDITKAIQETAKTLATLKSLEKKVEEELFEEVRTKSDKKISPFADPSSL